MSKISTLEKLLPKLEPVRKAGKIIAFTNGCFDILHAGHIRYLSASREQGDLLVVGLNSDKSIKSIKGDKRPLVNQNQRAEVLEALWFVDHITIFEDPDPLKLIREVNPHVLVKGADWAENEIIGGDYVKTRGGKVVRIPLADGISTSGIIDRILKIYRQD